MNTIFSIRNLTRLIVASLILFSQPIFSKELEQDDIYKLISSAFKSVAYEDNGITYYFEKIDTLPNENPLSELTNSNMLYIDYIISNFSNIDYLELEKYNHNVNVRNDSYINMLRNSETFNRYFYEMVAHYLSSKGNSIKGYKIGPKLRVSLDELSNCAAKFFYPQKLVDSSALSFKVCVGINGHADDRENGKDKEKDEMYPLVEAFCAMTILENLGNSELKFRDIIKECGSKACNETTDIKDSEERLQAARLIVYQNVAKNENLRKLLISQYKQKRKILNFELIQ